MKNYTFDWTDFKGSLHLNSSVVNLFIIGSGLDGILIPPLRQALNVSSNSSGHTTTDTLTCQVDRIFVN